MIEVIKSPTPVTEKTQWTVFLAGPMPQWKKEMITKKIFSGISYYHYYGSVALFQSSVRSPDSVQWKC
jgi:hypothetical protein